ELTFTSSDHDPATAGVTVVGYDDPSKSLPTQVLASRLWFDLCTGNHYGGEAESYANFACREALAGRWSKVEIFLDLCHELQIDDADDIDLIHRVAHESHVCTEQEMLRVHDRP